MYKTHFSSVVKIACMVTVVTHANHIINKPQGPDLSGFLSASVNTPHTGS